MNHQGNNGNQDNKKAPIDGPSEELPRGEGSRRRSDASFLEQHQHLHQHEFREPMDQQQQEQDQQDLQNSISTSFSSRRNVVLPQQIQPLPSVETPSLLSLLAPHHPLPNPMMIPIDEPLMNAPPHLPWMMVNPQDGEGPPSLTQCLDEALELCDEVLNGDDYNDDLFMDPLPMVGGFARPAPAPAVNGQPLPPQRRP